MSDEIWVGVISAIGSGVFGICSFFLKKKCPDGGKLRKDLNILRAHDIATLSLNSENKIICEDTLRTEFFQQIQSELLFDIINNKINKFIDDLHEKNQDLSSYSLIEIKSLLRFLGNDIINAQTQYIVSLQDSICQLITNMLHNFHKMIQNLSCSTSSVEAPKDAILIYFSAMLVSLQLTINEWKSIAGRVNGQLCGHQWKNNTFMYRYDISEDLFINNFDYLVSIIETNNTFSSFVITDSDFRMIYISDNTCKCTKRERGDLILKKYYILEGGASGNTETNNSINVRLQENKSITVQLSARTGNNDNIYIYAYILPIIVNDQRLYLYSQMCINKIIVDKMIDFSTHKRVHTQSAFVMSCLSSPFECITCSLINSSVVDSKQRDPINIDYLYNGNTLSLLNFNLQESLSSQMGIHEIELQTICKQCRLQFVDFDEPSKEYILVDNKSIEFCNFSRTYKSELWMIDNVLLVVYRLTD